MVKDIRPGEDWSYPDSLTMLGGVLYFTANGGTHDRYERRTYELDRLIGQLFLAGVSGRNLERVSAEPWGRKVSRSTVSRATAAFEDEQRQIIEAQVPAEVRYLFLDGQNTRSGPHSGSPNREMLAAFTITPDGTERLHGYRLASSESEDEWAVVLEASKARIALDRSGASQIARRSAPPPPCCASAPWPSRFARRA